MFAYQAEIGMSADRSDSQRWFVLSFALVAFCVLTFAQASVADCWDDPWICDERDIGCFHPNWMENLEGSLLISEVSIPGTHETMASEAGDILDLTYCQSVQDLRKQLDAGIRALDIRCRHVHNRFAIHHGVYYQEAYFGEPLNIGRHWGSGGFHSHNDAGDKNVMKACVQFLYDNPSEFIVMNIQPTHTDDAVDRTFAETLQWYIEEDGCKILTDTGDSVYFSYKDFFWISDNYLHGYPTVDEVRGKIVILQSFVTRYQVGNAPRKVIAADLDRNGYSDLVTVNIDDNNVAVLLNRGDGTFEKKFFYTGGGPRDVCAADLDADGWLDLAVVKYNNPGGNYLAILFNSGDGHGNFKPYVDYYVENDPVAIAVTDHNRDGLPDLIIAGQASSEISVMTNIATAPGTLSRHDHICGGGPRDVVSADFNDDGWPDIALVKFRNPGRNYMAILFNSGDGHGNFEPYVDYYVEDDPVAIAVTDHNRDGLPDLIIAGQASSEISVMTNIATAPGTLSRHDHICGGGPKDVVSADFNDDGWPDIAVVKYNNPGHNYMATLLNSGDGHGNFDHYVDYYTGNDPTGICASDLDLDGNLELITAAISERQVEIFNGEGTGAFYSAEFGYPWAILNKQNEYQIACTEEGFDNKWLLIQNQLLLAARGGHDTLYINFTSGTVKGMDFICPTPWDVADGLLEWQGMNQRTYNYLNSFLPYDPERRGVIMMDYPGPGLIEAVINQNNLIPTGVDDEDEDETLPGSFEICQNYPNPFNPVTTMEYRIPRRSQVNVEIFNILGQKVRTLLNETRSAGLYQIEWDGKDDTGRQVPTGVYLYRFQAGDVIQTKKMVLLK